MTLSIGQRVRVNKPNDDRHNHIAHVEFVSDVAPTIYGVRFPATQATGEFLHSELIALAHIPEDRPAELKKTRSDDPMMQARMMVRAIHYPGMRIEEIYVVWFCAALQNWKALVSTNVKDNSYYEVTADGAKNCAYVDKYLKVNNQVVSLDVF